MSGAAVRFLHTSDWQLGITRHFLDDEAQGRFTQARYDAIRTMAGIAARYECAFVVVAGDVFESNQVARQTVSRALQALGQFDVPVYLLPGNHDCLRPGSIYESRAFTDACPEHVHVLSDSQPRHPVEGVEVIGAPWTSKRPLTDLASEACRSQKSSDERLRVVVAHGIVDDVAGDPASDPAVIRLANVEAAIREGVTHYVALGDRHSMTRVGDTGRVWYSGAPEATDYVETDPGHALLVDLDAERAQVDPVDVGTWHFRRLERDVNTDDDIAGLDQQLRELDDPARTIVKLELTGTLTLHQRAELDERLGRHDDVLAALEQPPHHQDLAIRPDDNDFSSLDLTGYVAEARDLLQERANNGPDGGGPDSEGAAEALSLLLRLSKEAS